MTRRRTRSANYAFSEMEHVGSFYICSICKALLLPSASDGARDLRGGSGDEWLGQPHPPCTKSDPTWGAEVWGEVGGENGRPPPHRLDGALWRRRSQGSHGRAADRATCVNAPLYCSSLSHQFTLERIWYLLPDTEFKSSCCLRVDTSAILVTLFPSP